jgi:hypothetical protein
MASGPAAREDGPALARPDQSGETLGQAGSCYLNTGVRPAPPNLLPFLVRCSIATRPARLPRSSYGPQPRRRVPVPPEAIASLPRRSSSSSGAFTLPTRPQPAYNAERSPSATSSTKDRASSRNESPHDPRPVGHRPHPPLHRGHRPPGVPRTLRGGDRAPGHPPPGTWYGGDHAVGGTGMPPGQRGGAREDRGICGTH